MFDSHSKKIKCVFGFKGPLKISMFTQVIHIIGPYDGEYHRHGIR